MKGTRLNCLCEPITSHGWLQLPLSVRSYEGGEEWSIRLFQVGRDEDVLLSWRLVQPPPADPLLQGQSELVASFQAIAESPDMQAFMIWRGQQAIMQLDVVNANTPLAELYIPVEGSFLLYIKNCVSALKIELVKALSMALPFFFQFPEVESLYAICEPDAMNRISILSELGFVPVSLGQQDVIEVLALTRIDYLQKLANNSDNLN